MEFRWFTLTYGSANLGLVLYGVSALLSLGILLEPLTPHVSNSHPIFAQFVLTARLGRVDYGRWANTTAQCFTA